MARYNIYAGLSGVFGGAIYHMTEDFDTEEEALEVARRLAIEEHQSYEGTGGVYSWDDMAEEYRINEEIPEDRDLTEEDLDIIDNLYQEEIESWIDYRAILESEDNKI